MQRKRTWIFEENYMSDGLSKRTLVRKPSYPGLYLQASLSLSVSKSSVQKHFA